MQLLILVASHLANPVMRAAQESLLQLLDTRKFAYTTIDCTEPEHRELRTAAWAISGKRALYPQVFLRSVGSGTEAMKFVGDWDMLSELNENNEEFGGLDKALEGVERK